jgi:hypothetical protein
VSLSDLTYATLSGLSAVVVSALQQKH